MTDTTQSPPLATLVVLIPCLNEDATVGRVIDQVPRTIPGVSGIEILVIDDGSTDSTAEVAASAGAHVIRQGRNLGLGRAFRTGVNWALREGADIAVNIDGDGQFDAADIHELLAPILAGSARMVTASRFKDPDLLPEMPRIKRWGNAWVARIVSLITGKRYRDVSCGFRAFDREALLRLNLFGDFTYTQETFIDLLFKGVTIEELPIRVRGVREHGKSRIASSLGRYGLQSLKIMFRAAIGYRPFRFFATIAAFCLAVGFALLAFLLWHYLEAGSFSPHIWAGFVGGSFSFLGLSTLVVGFIGDILVRMRMNQEEILYLLKRRALADGSGP